MHRHLTAMKQGADYRDSIWYICIYTYIHIYTDIYARIDVQAHSTRKHTHLKAMKQSADHSDSLHNLEVFLAKYRRPQFVCVLE